MTVQTSLGDVWHEEKKAMDTRVTAAELTRRMARLYSMVSNEKHGKYARASVRDRET